MEQIHVISGGLGRRVVAHIGTAPGGPAGVTGTEADRSTRPPRRSTPPGPSP